MNPIDFRDEFYSKSLRRLVVISTLATKKKFLEGVPKRIAIVADFLLCNPQVLQNFLESFGKPQQALRVNELLYHDNISSGAVDEEIDFGRTIALLTTLGLISVTQAQGDLTLKCTWTLDQPSTPLMEEWKANLADISPLLTSRSENVIFRKIIGDFINEQESIFDSSKVVC